MNLRTPLINFCWLLHLLPPTFTIFFFLGLYFLKKPFFGDVFFSFCTLWANIPTFKPLSRHELACHVLLDIFFFCHSSGNLQGSDSLFWTQVGNTIPVIFKSSNLIQLYVCSYEFSDCNAFIKKKKNLNPWRNEWVMISITKFQAQNSMPDT